VFLVLTLGLVIFCVALPIKWPIEVARHFR